METHSEVSDTRLSCVKRDYRHRTRKVAGMDRSPPIKTKLLGGALILILFDLVFEDQFIWYVGS